MANVALPALLTGAVPRSARAHVRWVAAPRGSINLHCIHPSSARRALCRPRAAPALASAAPGAAAQRYVKVCGVTNVEDAEIAAAAGANLIGMILWPRAKRSISPAVAREIAAAARRHGAAPVAVFVDEDAATIQRVCEESEVEIAQLHGDGARASLLDLPPRLRCVYVMHADKGGALQTATPKQLAAAAGRELQREVQWVLLDSLQGGSGEAFDWANLQPPLQSCSQGWLLAGGLTPDNVAQAAALARPAGVDVSSGVCGPDGLKKDADRVRRYVASARQALAAL